MPIYAYKCESCGYAKDVLQKMSDTPLSECPQCGASSFKKQVTAAGFQLKGSGWYVTDFRGGNSGTTVPKPADAGSGESSKSADGPAPAASGASSPSPATAPAAPASASGSPAKSTGGDASTKSS